MASCSKSDYPRYNRASPRNAKVDSFNISFSLAHEARNRGANGSFARPSYFSHKEADQYRDSPPHDAKRYIVWAVHP